MPQLPPEVFARLDCLHNLKELEDQNDIFSELLPLPGKKSIRWFKPMKCFPFHHRIDSRSQSKRIEVEVLTGDHESVLVLKGENSAWQRAAHMSLKDFARNQKTYYQNGKWRPKTATTSQINYIAQLMAVPPDELPPISAYNAAYVIDASLMMRHWRRAELLARIWLSELQTLKVSA